MFEKWKNPVFLFFRTSVATLVFLETILVYWNSYKPECFWSFERHVSESFPFSPTFKRIVMEVRVLRLVVLLFAQIDDCPKIGIAAVSCLDLRPLPLSHDDVSNIRVNTISADQGSCRQKLTIWELNFDCMLCRLCVSDSEPSSDLYSFRKTLLRQYSA